MLYGALVSTEVSGRFTARTANVAATDFRHLAPALNPDDLDPATTAGDLVSEITPSGIVSGKCNDITVPSGGAWEEGPAWSWLPLVGTDDQEALALLELSAQSSTGTALDGGVAVKSSYGNYVAAGIGRISGVGLGSVRMSGLSGTFEINGSAGTWATNTPYWIRLRIEATRQLMRKVWSHGTAEPGSWSTFSVASNRWPVAGGLGGVVIRRMSGGPTRLRVHYLAYAYNGNPAPFPWEVPA